MVDYYTKLVYLVIYEIYLPNLVDFFPGFLKSQINISNFLYIIFTHPQFTISFGERGLTYTSQDQNFIYPSYSLLM